MFYFFYRKSIIEGAEDQDDKPPRDEGSGENGAVMTGAEYNAGAKTKAERAGGDTPEEREMLKQLRLDFCDKISKYNLDTLEGIYNYIYIYHLVLKKPDAEITAGFENQLFKDSKDFKDIVNLIKTNFIDDSANVSGYSGYLGFMVVIDEIDSATYDKFPIQRARYLRLLCSYSTDIQKFYDLFKTKFPERNNNNIFKDIADEQTFGGFSLSSFGASTIADIYTCLDLLKNALSETENANQEFFKNLQLPAI